ncbi:MAG: glutamyl-tRNA reductase [Bacteroidota bacterium]
MVYVKSTPFHFCMAGVNYRKTDGHLRSRYALNDSQYETLLQLAGSFQVEECFVISTCNRTEIYGTTDSVNKLMQLLCTQTEGDLAGFEQIAYAKKGEEAIAHLFDVVSGLDSQILGDYEIVGQVKKSVKIARQYGMLGAYTDRVTNLAFQCSKKIKTSTCLSGGTISVSFAAIQYLKDNLKDASNKKILLIGTGKFGRITCKNLVDYLDNKNITLLNRSICKAESLAAELGLQVAPMEALPELLKTADAVLVATNAQKPIILKEQLDHGREMVVIDLSIPFNVEESVKELPTINLINVDDLSRIKDETLEKRYAEVPKAKAIINTHIQEFMEWVSMRRYVPVMQSLKSKLIELHESQPELLGYSSKSTEKRIQNAINGMVNKMRRQDNKGCHYLEAINEFMTATA